jgi:hypothetical protein
MNHFFVRMVVWTAVALIVVTAGKKWFKVSILTEVPRNGTPLFKEVDDERARVMVLNYWKYVLTHRVTVRTYIMSDETYQRKVQAPQRTKLCLQIRATQQSNKDQHSHCKY